MQRESLIAILVGISFLVVGGCANTSGVWVDKGKNLHVEDPAFATNIEVLNSIYEKTPEGFLHAQVEVNNTNRTDYECLYMVEWLRENNMTQSHAEMPWRPILLHGRTPTRLEAVCPVKGAENFRFLIRRKN